MSDEDITTWGYKTSYTWNRPDEKGASLDELAKLMREFQRQFDNEIGHALFNPSRRPSLRIDPPEYKPERLPFLHGIPVTYSRYIPQGDAYAIRGYGVILGAGTVEAAVPESVSAPEYTWPAWLPFVILALALILLVLML
jgi:hypothetical protein